MVIFDFSSSHEHCDGAGIHTAAAARAHTVAIPYFQRAVARDRGEQFGIGRRPDGRVDAVLVLAKRANRVRNLEDDMKSQMS
jgi:hypothetical protein